MSDDIDFFEQGKEDCRAYYKSQAFAGLTRYMPADIAIVLFWPPVEEAPVMMSTPLPKPRREWIAGFRKEQAAMSAIKEEEGL